MEQLYVNYQLFKMHRNEQHWTLWELTMKIMVLSMDVEGCNKDDLGEIYLRDISFCPYHIVR